MSTLRKRFRITVDEVPHDIVTSARDYAALDLSGAGEPVNQSMQTWAVLHSACMRLDVPGVPHDLDKFIDLLDEVEDLDGIPYGVTANPTQETHTDDSRSP
jgi:hypothetical protein